MKIAAHVRLASLFAVIAVVVSAALLARAEDKPSPAPAGNVPAGADRNTDAAVTRFLQKYAAAMSAGDVKAIAALWDTPAFAVSDQRSRAVGSREEVERFFAAARQQYVSRGMRAARPEVQSTDWISDRLAIVKVRWLYLDDRGKEIAEESMTYTLRRGHGPGDMKVVVAMHPDQNQKNR